MKPHRTTFAFSDTEKKMLDGLCGVMGCNPSELLREMIRTRYLKLFPPYTDKKVKLILEKEELTDEQFCEKWGGKVVKSGGAGGKCEMELGGSLVSMMLTDRKTISQYGKDA